MTSTLLGHNTLRYRLVVIIRKGFLRPDIQYEGSMYA